MKKESEKKAILENIRWFKKFPLEKRFEIAEQDTKSTKILKSLHIEEYAKSKRTN